MTLFKKLKWKNPLKRLKSKYTIEKKKEIVIYFVDDNVYYLKLMKANLYKMGFTNIKGFSSGEELLLHLEDNNKPDVIILDYIIEGGMDAFENVTEIKKYKLDCSIVILSGQSDVEKATMIIKNGASDYIVKNNLTFFNLENILMKIKKKIFLKIETDIIARKSRVFYQIAILIIWVILIVVLYSKIRTGIF